MSVVTRRCSDRDSFAMSVFSQSWYRNLCGLVPSPKTSADGLEGVRQDTRDITEFILADFLALTDYRTKASNKRTVVVMKTLMRQVLESDGEKFTALAREMDMSRLAETPNLVVRTVLDSMFEDGRIHWLRIVAGYVYAVQLAQRCQADGRKELAKTVMRAVGHYIVTENIALWIHDQGGWTSISTAFADPKDLEQNLKSVGYLLLTVGFGALFSAVITR